MFWLIEVFLSGDFFELSTPRCERALRLNKREFSMDCFLFFPLKSCECVVVRETSLFADRGNLHLDMADFTGDFFSADLEFILFDDGGGDGVLDMDLRLLAKDVLHPERDLLRFLKGEMGGGSPIDRSMALCRIFAICVSMRGVGFSRHSASLARVTASHSSSYRLADRLLKTRSISSSDSDSFSYSDKWLLEVQDFGLCCLLLVSLSASSPDFRRRSTRFLGDAGFFLLVGGCFSTGGAGEGEGVADAEGGWHDMVIDRVTSSAELSAEVSNDTSGTDGRLRLLVFWLCCLNKART